MLQNSAGYCGSTWGVRGGTGATRENLGYFRVPGGTAGYYGVLKGSGEYYMQDIGEYFGHWGYSGYCRVLQSTEKYCKV